VRRIAAFPDVEQREKAPAANRRVTVIAPAFLLAPTRLPLGHKADWLFDCYTRSETGLK
jgi:hypothetical protein